MAGMTILMGIQFAYGYDWGHPLTTETREHTRYAAMAYIEMRRGQKTAHNNHAFDASEVLKNLGPIECWKKEIHDKSKCKLSHPS